MIFEDDEKDNIELDASISSDDTEGISWDDLLDEAEDKESQVELEPSKPVKNKEAEPIKKEVEPVELTDGLEGINEAQKENEIVEGDLDSFVNLDMLEDQNDAPLIEETSAQTAPDMVSDISNLNYTQPKASSVPEVSEVGADISDISYDNSSNNSARTNSSDIIGIASLNNSNANEDIDSNAFNVESEPAESDNRGSKLPIILGVITAILVIAAIAIAIVIFSGKGDIFSSLPNILNSNSQTNNESYDMGYDQMSNENLQNNENISLEENEAVPTNAQDISGGAPQEDNQKVNDAKKENEKVVVNVTRGGRANPFSPVGNINAAGYTVPTLGNLAPPTEVGEDEELGKLVDIVCTGILYDNIKPSAIITVGGVDYFVQKGDRVDKFIVFAINPTSVVIRNGTNSYVATIGQQFDVQGEPAKMNYVYNGKSKPVTRQYLSPSEVDVEVKVK